MQVLAYVTLFFASLILAGASHPCSSFETCGALYSKEYLLDVYYSGLRRVAKKATTHLCRQKIEYEFMKHFRALAEESVYPFENVLFESQCKNSSHKEQLLKPIGPNIVKLGHNDTLTLMPNVTARIDPAHLSILYVMLVHNHPEFAVRIINALDEPMHHFVIHVDASAEDVQTYLTEALTNRTNIHILQKNRETISWGGFSIVNATLNAIRYAWEARLPFHYMIDISGTTYPLKSNAFIRATLSENPNAVFMETYPTPVRPEGIMWNQFVECDGALHRITRLAAPRGIHMHVSSQWFAVPRHYVWWLLYSSLARNYIHYAQYIIIADENYFATMFYNSPYCQTEVRKNLVFLLFDRWEHERNTTETGRPRDKRKCLGVGENNCGRSPTTLTMDYKNLISSSRMLFARKFDPNNVSSMELVAFIDSMRGTYGNTSKEVTERWDSNKDNGAVNTMIKVGRDLPSATSTAAQTTAAQAVPATSAATEQALAMLPTDDTATVVDTTVGGSTQHPTPAPSAMCLAYTTESPGYIRKQPCDPGNPHQWFEIGRCTFGYTLELRDHECPVFRKTDASGSETTTNTTAGAGSEDVFCSILTRAENKELCVDIAGENPAPGTPVLGYDCTGRWNQLFKLTRNCTIVVEQPGFIGRVRGRGDRTITNCLDARHDAGILMTAQCAHLQAPVPQQNATADGVVEAEVNVDGAASRPANNSTNDATSAATANDTPWKWQQFQFMPASGTAFREHMGPSVSSAEAASLAEGTSDRFEDLK